MRKGTLLATLAMGPALAIGGIAAPAAATAPALSPSVAQDGSVGTFALPNWCSPPRGELWDTDGRTVGVRCDVTYSYYARVSCTNGSQTKVQRGVGTNDNRWSYAYCTAFGSSWRVVPGTGTAVRS